jgi:hypothetical protein
VSFALGLAAALLTTHPGFASAAPTASHRARPASEMSLAQAPVGLQAAVRATLGTPTPAIGPGLQAELAAPDGATSDAFGWTVALSGSTAVLGAPGKLPTGAAYVFVRSGSIWSQQAELTASDGTQFDAFGGSVAISGSTAVVGAPDRNSFTGAAYVFVRSGSVWSQQAELTASDGASIDYFGVSVGISGSTVVVGAEGKNSFTGAAYMFVRSGTVWSQQAELTASDGAQQDSLGHSVAISGSTAVVGAYAKNHSTGAAYVFLRSGSVWSQQAKLTASDGARGDYFGWSVAVSGSTAVAGAFARNADIGAAYVFLRSGSVWSQQAELTASDGAQDDAFGFSVAIAGSAAVVGLSPSNSNPGAAYVFLRSGTAWSQKGKLTAFDGGSNDAFGHAVAISRSTMLVGAYGHDSSTGAAYVFVPAPSHSTP